MRNEKSRYERKKYYGCSSITMKLGEESKKSQYQGVNQVWNQVWNRQLTRGVKNEK